MARPRKKLTQAQKLDRKRDQKKNSMKRYRQRLKQDPVALEEARRKDRERKKKKKEQGSVKTIKDLTPREQRNLRKYWREHSQKYRNKKNCKKILRYT